VESQAAQQDNLGRYGQRLRSLFGALKAAHLAIDTVEFGSEDDTPITTPTSLQGTRRRRPRSRHGCTATRTGQQVVLPQARRRARATRRRRPTTLWVRYTGKTYV
jgi:hypothetical protein